MSDLALAAVCFALVFGVFLWRPLGHPDPTRHPAVGQSAAFLHAYPLEVSEDKKTDEGTQSTSLGSPLTGNDLVGKVVVAALWAPWIPESIEALSNVARALPVASQEDLRFLGITCFPPPGRILPEDFYVWTLSVWREMEIPAVCYVDLERVTESQFRVFCRAESSQDMGIGILPLPTILLIDRSGLVRAVWTGWLPGQERQIKDMVEKLLSSPSGKTDDESHAKRPGDPAF